jgi:hypothetical protein
MVGAHHPNQVNSPTDPLLSAAAFVRDGGNGGSDFGQSFGLRCPPLCRLQINGSPHAAEQKLGADRFVDVIACAY